MAKYSKAAQKTVSSAMKRMKKGTLKSGVSGKKVTDPKQAIAIGLSEAKQKGAKVPKKKPAAKTITKKAAPKKGSAKRTVNKKSSKAKPVQKKTVQKKVTIKKAAEKKGAKAAGGKKLLSTNKTVQAQDINIAPVEEKSPVIIPFTPDKPADPIMVSDKKALAKAVTKHHPGQRMQLSGPKSSIRPSGKKPLWR